MGGRNQSGDLIVKNIYLHKPKRDEKGNYIFENYGCVPFFGIVITILYMGLFPFLDDIIIDCTKNIYLTLDQYNLIKIILTVIFCIMIFTGIKMVIKGFFHKIVLNPHKITKVDSFLNKKESVIFDYNTEIKIKRGGEIVFKNGKNSVKFELDYGGLYELLEFLKMHFPPEKNEKVIEYIRTKIRKLG